MCNSFYKMDLMRVSGDEHLKRASRRTAPPPCLSQPSESSESSITLIRSRDAPPPPPIQGITRIPFESHIPRPGLDGQYDHVARRCSADPRSGHLPGRGIEKVPDVDQRDLEDQCREGRLIIVPGGLVPDRVRD